MISFTARWGGPLFHTLGLRLACSRKAGVHTRNEIPARHGLEPRIFRLWVMRPIHWAILLTAWGAVFHAFTLHIITPWTGSWHLGPEYSFGAGSQIIRSDTLPFTTGNVNPISRSHILKPLGHDCSQPKTQPLQPSKDRLFYETV